MDAGLKKGHNPNPQTAANPVSLITFWWILDIFRVGFKKDLEVEDLYDALEEHKSSTMGNKLEKLWEQELYQAKLKHKEPSLLRILVKCFWVNAFWLGLAIATAEFLFQMTQPIFLGRVIRYFSPNSDMNIETAYLYAAAVIICSFFNTFIKNPAWLGEFHTGMKMRVGLCSLLYRKALRLSKTALGETTVGQAVNLLSNDVSRFDRSFIFLPYLWIGPIQTMIIIYMIWLEIGLSAIIGIAAILLVMPIQGGIGKMVSTFRLRTAKRTDDRIRFMNEIVVGIQVIKMYAWEKPFAHLVALARRREIKAVRASCFMRGFLLSFGRYGTRIAICVSIVTYVLLQNKLTAEKMFVVTAYFNIVKQSMTDFFPLGIIEMAESLISIKRIQEFLLRQEVSTPPDLENNLGRTGINNAESKYIEMIDDSLHSRSFSNQVVHGDGKAGGDVSVDLKGINLIDVTAKWTEELNENTLTSINMNVRQGELVAVIGPVGSGKTSLLHTILKELPIKSGSVLVNGSISYASQEPWLFTGSVRQNILFGQSMDRRRYKEVVNVCSLERDFQLLPYGDKTIVGERGITLSGGQRARINLARAMYKEADIYLLDDPLSAVDTHVGRHLFDDCICGFLQNKTRVLVTHQLQYLQTADKIVIISSGKIVATGTYVELQNSQLDFAKQLELETTEDDDEMASSHSHNSSSSLNKRKRMSSESSQMSSVNELEPERLAEMRTKGTVSSRIYQSYFAAGGNWIVTLFMLGLCVLAQVATSGGDYWMSYWSNVEEQRMAQSVIPSNIWNFSDAQNNTTGLVSDGAFMFDNISITNFTKTNSTEWIWLPSRDTCIIVFVVLLVAAVFLIILSILCFFLICMKASINLHNEMFSSIIHAKMWFFNKNPSGQILNRFSKDMGAIDEILPMTMIDCIEIGFLLLGVVIVVAIVNIWLLIPAVIMFCIFFVLRMYYVATSRSVKRLEGITRSPVFSHLNASLQGLTTIRALHAETMLEKEFDNHQDLHSSAWYMFILTTRAFAVWLDSTCLIYIALVTLSFLIIGGEYYGGDVGLAITQAIGLTGMIQWGMRQSAELENQMTSVERVLEYTTVEKESSFISTPSNKPKDGWPSQGAVVFDKVFLAYSKDEPTVLKNVNFCIKPAEKVGIVGRTGAGKSSLISALFRLVDVCNGSIHIDQVDISSVGLHELRTKISIIPQEPGLFSGTLRFNLDPFSQFSDATLWAALTDVELKQAVEDLPAGLSHRVSEGGSNFSVGQRQLLCLARAIIRNNKILLLDEATANVDPQTDELIQATIRRKFSNCTVLTVAHRLNTVMDSDRIIVMDAGSVVEFDHPYLLVKNKGGVLYHMVQQTGHAMAESLLRSAQLNYEETLRRRHNAD